MENQIEFAVKIKVIEEMLLEHLMERIEHPEIAVIFERFRDYLSDVELAKKQLAKKIERQNFI